jgi:hypothetical protein
MANTEALDAEEIERREREAIDDVASTARRHVDRLPESSPWHEALSHLATRLEAGAVRQRSDATPPD